MAHPRTWATHACQHVVGKTGAQCVCLGTGRDEMGHSEQEGRSYAWVPYGNAAIPPPSPLATHLHSMLPPPPHLHSDVLFHLGRVCQWIRVRIQVQLHVQQGRRGPCDQRPHAPQRQYMHRRGSTCSAKSSGFSCNDSRGRAKRMKLLAAPPLPGGKWVRGSTMHQAPPPPAACTPAG